MGTLHSKLAPVSPLITALLEKIAVTVQNRYGGGATRTSEAASNEAFGATPRSPSLPRPGEAPRSWIPRCHRSRKACQALRMEKPSQAEAAGHRNPRTNARKCGNAGDAAG